MGVPIRIDAAIYADATEKGMKATKALQKSAVGELRIFDEKGRIIRRTDADIKPMIIENSGDEKTLSEPFKPEED